MIDFNPLILALVLPVAIMGQSATLERTAGKMAYTLHGEGSTLVIAIPGIGDNQDQYRFMVPELVKSGYQVATVDLRGHGKSSTDWPDYSSAANGTDLVALIDELNADDIILIGNSFGGAMSVWAAAERPAFVKAIVMINPFVEDPKMKWYQKLLFGVALGGPWGKSAWLKVYGNNYPSQKPADFEDHLADLKSMLSRPGGYKAFLKTATSSHANAAKRIPEVNVPVKVLIGSQDPDYKDQQAELDKLVAMFRADGSMIDGAGHYPHVEFPEVTNQLVLEYLRGIHDSKTQETGSATGTE